MCSLAREPDQVFRDVTLNLHSEVDKMVVWFPPKNTSLTRESLAIPPSKTSTSPIQSLLRLGVSSK